MNRVVWLYVVKWRLIMRLLLMHVIAKAAKARSTRRIC
jgi:hypothetical protein